MSKENIRIEELKRNKHWKRNNLIPPNRILLIVDRSEFKNIFPRLKTCRNLHFLTFGFGLPNLPPELFELTQLKYLDLSHNKLKHLPEELGNLQNLQSLDLSDNKLLKLPEELFGLQNLERLYLEDNVLQEIPPLISRLKKLQTLYLSDNLLSELPASFSEMHQLKEVSLVNNLITSIKGDFSGWSQLKHFYLAGNPLLSLPASISRISLTVKEVNSLCFYLLSNPLLQEINIFDSAKFDSREEILNQLSPQIRKKEALHISEW